MKPPSEKSRRKTQFNFFICFDIMKSFKNYFPHNNHDVIIFDNNARNQKKLKSIKYNIKKNLSIKSMYDIVTTSHKGKSFRENIYD